MISLRRKTNRKSNVGRRLGVESLERRELFALADLPVLMVIANQRDFYWQEYGHTRQSLEAAGLNVVVAATTTSPSTPHSNSGQGASSGIVTPNITLASANASNYSAIVFVGGYGSSMYQYAWPGDYQDNLYDGNAATKQVVNNLINDFVAQDKYVTAICHGVMALAWARVNGVSPINGKNVSVPWLGSPANTYQGQFYNGGQLLQSTQANQNGAITPPRSGAVGNPGTVADDVVVDGKIITAENYDSALTFGSVIAQRIWAESTTRVNAAAPTVSGARVTFNEAVNTGGLNLYDYRNASGQSVLGAADVQLTGATTGAVTGSLIADATGTTFTFAATNGALPPDTYTLRVRSAADAFRSATGQLLDGDANGVAGGDYVTTFQVAANSAVAVSLPNFTRGPQQAVNVPADQSLGLPLQLSDGAGATSLQFELRFDSSLLSISNVSLPATAPAGSLISWSNGASGVLTGTINFGAPLAAGAQIAAYLQASVPASAQARYGAAEILDLTNLQLRGPGGVSIAAADVDAVHVNAYYGDLGGNGRYDSFDVQQASRMALRTDSGSQQFPLFDPALLGDLNGNRRIDSFDVQRLSRLALRLPVAEVPALPGTSGGGGALSNSGDDDAKPYHNAREGMRADVDENGVVDAQDILWTIFAYNKSPGAFKVDDFPQLKFDVTGDNSCDPDDILTAIHDADQMTNGEGESADDGLEWLALDVAQARKKK